MRSVLPEKKNRFLMEVTRAREQKRRSSPLSYVTPPEYKSKTECIRKTLVFTFIVELLRRSDYTSARALHLRAKGIVRIIGLLARCCARVYFISHSFLRIYISVHMRSRLSLVHVVSRHIFGSHAE